MKRKILAMVLATVFLVGCNGVWMNARYSQLLDQTAALSQNTADRAAADTITCDQMKEALAAQAEVWEQFRAARDGRAE